MIGKLCTGGPQNTTVCKFCSCRIVEVGRCPILSTGDIELEAD